MNNITKTYPIGKAKTGQQVHDYIDQHPNAQCAKNCLWVKFEEHVSVLDKIENLVHFIQSIPPSKLTPEISLIALRMDLLFSDLLLDKPQVDMRTRVAEIIHETGALKFGNFKLSSQEKK